MSCCGISRLPAGSIAGIEVVITMLAESKLHLCDANQLGAALGLISVNRSKQATIQSNDAPDSPPTASTLPTSLWQDNFGAKINVGSGVAKIEDCGSCDHSG